MCVGEERIYEVGFTEKEIIDLVEGIDSLKKIARARRVYKKLLPIADSLRETTIYKFGASDDELPF